MRLSRSLILLRILEFTKERIEDGFFSFKEEDLGFPRQKRHTVYRVLKELEREGYLRLDGKYWAITRKMLILLTSSQEDRTPEPVIVRISLPEKREAKCY